jgi:serine/threonine protein kinase
VFDTSTVIADGGPQSPGKSAIPRRESSCSD